MQLNLSMTTQGLALLFSHIAENDYKVIWVRNCDYSKQLYLSLSFKTVWKRPCEALYEYPDSWGDTLVGENTNTFVQLLKCRQSGGKEETLQNNTVLYRIHDTHDNISWIKDSHFYLFNQDKQQVAVAGIAEAISEAQWYLEMEKNCSFEEDRSRHFQNNIITALEKELKLTAYAAPHAILLDENYGHFCSIITSDGGRIKLSKREIECLHYVSKGCSDKQIAKSLTISPRTVEAYVNRLKKKIHCRRRTELMSHIKGFSV